MPAPVIDTRTSVLSVEEGGELVFLPSATGSPTSWSSSTLPPNTTFSTATGQYVFSPEAGDAGLYSVTLTATNASGSDEIVIIVPFYETVPEDLPEFANTITVGINVDIVTGAVSFIGADGFEFGPPTENKREEGYRKAVFLVKEGDRFPVAIGFTRDGVLQDLDLRTLKAYASEFAPDEPNDLLESFTKVGEGDETRFYSTMAITESLWEGILSNYEEDQGTYVDTLAEIEYTVINASNEYDNTQSVAISSLKGNQTRNHTLSFTGIPQVESATPFSLEVIFDPTGTSTNDLTCTLSRTLDIYFNEDTGEYVVENEAGDSTDTVAHGEDYRWEPTLSLIQTTVDSNSVDVDLRVQTNDMGSGYIIVMPTSQLGYSPTIHGGTINFDPYGSFDTSIEVTLYDDNEGGGSGGTDYGNITDGMTAAQLLTHLQALASGTGGNSNFFQDVIFNDAEDTIYILCDPTDTDGNDYIYDPNSSNYFYPSFKNDIFVRSGTLSAQLVGNAIDDIHRRTSETFVLRAEKDLITDL